MKKTLFLIFIVFLAFAGCKDDNSDNKILDPGAMISLCAEVNTRAETSTNPERLSSLEVVKQAKDLWFVNLDHYDEGLDTGIGFEDFQRDTVNVRLLMWGSDVIDSYGEYIPDFIEAEDVILTRRIGAYLHETNDTIAYVKNATLAEAAIRVKAAYDVQDYTTVYSVFDEAFTFIPITGKEWRELKAKGEN